MSNKKTKKKGVSGVVVLLIAVMTVLVAAVMARHLMPVPDTPTQPVTDLPTQPAPSASCPADPTVTENTESAPTIRVELEEQYPVNLGHGLEIIDAGSYTGLYMEDGSDDIVSGVMMIVVRNTGEHDFQLADIDAVCGGGTCRFRLTNLPAGSQAVLLEQDRKPGGMEITSAVLENPVVFPEPMDLRADALRISGMDGMLNVENISGSAITGDIHIYYKYAAQDLYYGGITFRVRLEGGLKAGELRQIPAGHYGPEDCAIVQVEIHA